MKPNKFILLTRSIIAYLVLGLSFALYAKYSFAEAAQIDLTEIDKSFAETNELLFNQFIQQVKANAHSAHKHVKVGTKHAVKQELAAPILSPTTMNLGLLAMISVFLILICDVGFRRREMES